MAGGIRIKYLDEETEQIRYADGVFRSIYYHCSVILRYGDRLEEIAAQLRGNVRSPVIRNSDEAMYQRGTMIYPPPALAKSSIAS